MSLSIIFLLLLLPVSTFAFAGTNTAANNKNSISIGEAIQQSDATLEQLLETASRLWLPTDDNLPPHLLSQRVHHEKRQRWASQLLERIGTVYDNNSESVIFEDDRLSRAIRAAAVPFDKDRPDKEGRYVRQALMGMHTLLGKAVEDSYGGPLQEVLLNHDTNDDMFQLIQRAEAMTSKLPLSQVVELRFAARGIIRRLSLSDENKGITTPNMDQRVAKLPFDIVPLGVDWNNAIVPDNNNKNAVVVAVVDELLQSIPFQMDTITTRTGSVVTERRGTAWVAEPGIGALAYSGKLMTPQTPLPSVVTNVMQQVETIMLLPPMFFDCALCNHYPAADAACKFHTDPEHGTYWNRLTCVVAAGDCRRFAFRPIAEKKKKWSDFDPIIMLTTTTTTGAATTEITNAAAAIPLFSGDIVQMWGDCNDVFHHAVYAGEESSFSKNKERVSLVLKKALDRSGKRGHGLQGHGRRSKNKNKRNNRNNNNNDTTNNPRIPSNRKLK